MDNNIPQPEAAPAPDGQSPATPAKRRFSWWRLVISILLALITAALVYAIMLPAIVAPKP